MKKLGQLIIEKELRENGSIRHGRDYSNCPSKTDKSQAEETDINLLVKKFKPDELAAYMAARAYRKEITNHDFSRELSLQEAKNEVYQMKQQFEKLDPEIQRHFPNALEFMRFVSNPNNAQKLVDMKLATKKELTQFTPQTTQRTQDAKESKENTSTASENSKPN